MNCSIPENIDKNFFTVHIEKEKGKENLVENKTIQVKSRKRLKIIKLNLKPIQNKSQENKIMSTGRPSSDCVSTQNKKNQKMTVQESTQYGIPYNRSTPKERNVWTSRHTNSNVSTHNKGKV